MRIERGVGHTRAMLSPKFFSFLLLIAPEVLAVHRFLIYSTLKEVLEDSAEHMNQVNAVGSWRASCSADECTVAIISDDAHSATITREVPGVLHFATVLPGGVPMVRDVLAGEISLLLN
jgi:hypothetical protein